MKLIYKILIFVFILFLYLQFTFYYKTNNSTEIYEITQVIDKTKFEKICDTEKAPFIFSLNSDAIPNMIESFSFNKYNSLNVNTYNIKSLSSYLDDIKISKRKKMSFIEAMKNISLSDSFISDKNSSFIKDSHLENYLSRKDLFLKPNLMNYCEYDIIFGSNNTFTPLTYEINQRTYIMPIRNPIELKLVPPKYLKNLKIYDDSDVVHLDFKYNINIWNTNVPLDLDIETIDIFLPQNKLIFIPPFWGYSIHFLTNNTNILKFSYRNIINTISLIPYFIMQYTFDKSAFISNILSSHSSSSSSSSSPSQSQSLKNKKQNITSQSKKVKLQIQKPSSNNNSKMAKKISRKKNESSSSISINTNSQEKEQNKKTDSHNNIDVLLKTSLEESSSSNNSETLPPPTPTKENTTNDVKDIKDID